MRVESFHDGAHAERGFRFRPRSISRRTTEITHETTHAIRTILGYSNKGGMGASDCKLWCNYGNDPMSEINDQIETSSRRSDNDPLVQSLN